MQKSFAPTAAIACMLACICVEQIIPPDVWPSGRIKLSNIITKRIGTFTEREYAKFISNL